MTLDEARDHEGETLVHRFLDKDPEQAELVRVGDYALHVRLGDSGEIVTMHPRHFELPAAPPRTVTFDLSDPDTAHVLDTALKDYANRAEETARREGGSFTRWAAVADRMRAQAAAAGS